mgnify:CR=1 FL=1
MSDVSKSTLTISDSSPLTAFCWFPSDLRFCISSSRSLKSDSSSSSRAFKLRNSETALKSQLPRKKRAKNPLSRTIFQQQPHSVPLPASSSMRPTFSLEFSSLYEFSCRFHSSTLDVDSCNADVSLALLFFNVVSSTSHFLALAELHEWKTLYQINVEQMTEDKTTKFRSKL